MSIDTDILIIGSGIAGLSLALKASQEFNVLMIAKSEAMETNTRYAQGGIASVMGRTDHFDRHIKDTLGAGCYLNDVKVVESVIEQGPRLIGELLKYGVRFSRVGKDEFSLGMEGGHSHRRVLHKQDLTGFELQKKLLARAKKKSRIQILENTAAIDLIVDRHLKHRKKTNLCHGAYVLDRTTQNIFTIRARATVLSTGGAGKTYLYTSNPDIATGDGIAMAYRAGCQIANLEFVQFHPTCLYHPMAKSFLISEALRGEGGVLKLMDGSAFMHKYHPFKDLAPRDVVARAIDHELKKRGDKYALLDMTHMTRSDLKKRFPTIYKTCKYYGYDLALAPVPVVPAAHYFCGGVKVNLRGRTGIPNLYCIGEAACTGFHGANRLASNSLLEGVAFADFVHRDLLKRRDVKKNQFFPVRNWDPGKATNSDEAVVIVQNWDEIRRLMWNYVGIVRSNKRLIRAQRRIQILMEEIKQYYWDFILTTDLIELRNICRVADLTVRCALKRKQSIGLHYNIDCPSGQKPAPKFNIVQK